MAGETFHIANWKIENLSCWNQALHGKFIESYSIYFTERTFKMKLYPRGTSGQQNYMVVHISSGVKKKDLCGDLSFIGADGSTLYEQRVHFKDQQSDFELPPGPKFEDVIVKSRENESDPKDQLTLRLQIKSDEYDEFYICTVIEMFDVTMEVDPNVTLKAINEDITSFRYIHDDSDSNLHFKMGKIREDNKKELFLDSEVKNTLLVKTHLSLINDKGSLLRYENNEHMFQGKESWSFSESLTSRELSENVKSIVLHLRIISGKVSRTLRNLYSYYDDVKIISNRYISVCMDKSLNIEKNHDVIAYNDQETSSVRVLSKELMGLYQDQDFSDLQLKCEDISFSVHRSILSARSPVFKTMLSTDMTEAASGCVDIGDLDPSTLSCFLTFLYTGAVKDLEGESALKLYYAADKYQVPSLKRECVDFLRVNVSVSNVCDVLSFGTKHQDHELSAAANDFLLRNYNEVLKSSEWDSFMCSEPLLAVKTITYFAAKDFVIGNFNPL